ncbi:ICP0-binding domain of ubiquitin-specific protease 7-domain-containing protein [Circinella umbellata]|nr:ICP0-binding domain of ubiquitin-specific protease 7-domain-containing protein [Circinella umbellata]
MTTTKMEICSSNYFENDYNNETTSFIGTNPPRALSIVHDWKEIADMLFEPVNKQEIIETKCHHWKVRNWTAITNRALSTPFEVGGHGWTLVLYPKGNRWGKSINHISLYLAWNGKPEDSHASACVQFALVLSSCQYPTNYLVKWTEHRYDIMDEDHEDWGYTNMASIDTLTKVEEMTNRPALLNNEQMRISVIIRVLSVSSNSIQQRSLPGEKQIKIIGCVPIRNEKKKENDVGHTNVILQELYSICYFRRAILKSPAIYRNGALIDLQKLFYRMQISKISVDSQPFSTITNFGNYEDMYDPIQFQDKLMQQISEEQPTIQEHYDEMFGVRYKHSNKLEHVIKINISDSVYQFESCLSNMLVENGDIFTMTPPVLRFQIVPNLSTENNTFPNLHYPFIYPYVLNILPFVSRVRTNDDFPLSDQQYILQSVIVRKTNHTVSGQYYIYINRSPGSTRRQWYKIDTRQVTPVSEKEVFLFKNHTESIQNKRPFSSLLQGSDCIPYMLTYVQKSRLQEIFMDILLEDVPRNIARWVYDEWQGENIPFHNRVTILVFTNDIIAETNNEINLFNFNNPNITKFILDKSAPISRIYELLGKKLLLSMDAFRLWTINQRQNGTFKPESPVNHIDCSKVLLKKHLLPRLDNYTLLRQHEEEQTECYFYVEAPIINEQWNLFLDILIYIKYFDPHTQTILNVGHIVVHGNDQINSIIGKVNQMVGNKSDIALEFYEIVSDTMIKFCHNSKTFHDAKFQSGDIHCAQSVLSEIEQKEKYVWNGFKS